MSVKIHVIGIVDSPKYIKKLKKFGTVKSFSTFLGDPDLPDKVRGAEILIAQPRLHIDIMPYLDRCKMISVMATGYDAINLEAAREKGIMVCNVPDYATEAVCEHIFALMLAVARKIIEGDRLLRENKWRYPMEFMGVGLKGKTLGIFGFGKIGKRLAEMAIQGFSMKVICCTRRPEQCPPFVETQNPSSLKLCRTGFASLLQQSDFLCLAAPLTTETKGIFNKEAFLKMKKTAIFINTARGGLVDEAALVEALNNGKIAGAGVDVFQKEPPEADNPLLTAKNMVLSPHVAWAVEETVERLWEVTVENVEGFIKGKPQNVVN